MSTREQSVTQIHPHVVRRGNGSKAAAAPPPPPAFEIEEAPAAPDDDGPQLFSPMTASGRIREVFPLCVLETQRSETVAGWDAAEDEIRDVQGWRCVVFKYDALPGATKKQWLRVALKNEDPRTLTEEALYSSHGFGSYRMFIYALVEDDKGVVQQCPTRIFGFQIAPRNEARNEAPPPVDAPKAALMPAGPMTMPGGVPSPGSFQEWIAYQQMQATIAREEREREERAEERRLRLAREEEERAERRAEEKRRREREDEERREREEERRRARAREDEERREREEERRERRQRDLEMRLEEARARQLTSKTDPLSELKTWRQAIEEARESFGGGDGAGGTAERIVGNIFGAIEPHVPRIVETVGTIMTNAQKLEEMQVHLNQRIAELEASRGGVAPPRQQIPAVVVAPPPPAASPPAKTDAAPTPAPEVLHDGDKCPDCGAVIPGCAHFEPAPEIDGAAEDDDGCRECDPCEHPDEDMDAEGVCKQCPPCPHVDAVAVKPGDAIPPGAQLPPLGGFVAP